MELAKIPEKYCTGHNSLEFKRQENAAELQTVNEQLSALNRQLVHLNQNLRLVNDRLLSIFDQLRLVVAITNSQGRITFLSRPAEELFAPRAEAAYGLSWEELFQLPTLEQERLSALCAVPQSQRTCLTVSLSGGNGRHYLAELKVQDDPGDPQARIFFFHAVSAIYDLHAMPNERGRFQGLCGASLPMQLVYQQIRDVAKVDATVLIQGETGTGKELVAQAIQACGARKNRPFIPVNCAGLTESILTSQLFGHRRGAFTGAVADHVGLFEAAHGGTIFLDEIGDIPLSIQSHLLRVLQEKEITRLGESKPRKIDVRILAATHRNLGQEIAKGSFRQDLFYRLRVATIQLPPLRQRLEDLPPLVAEFLGQVCKTLGKQVQGVSYPAMQALLAYEWPGNVRELKGVLEFAVIRCTGAVLQLEDLPDEIRSSSWFPQTELTQPSEKQRLAEALKHTGGNRTAAAHLLGMSRATFYRKLASQSGLPEETPSGRSG